MRRPADKKEVNLVHSLQNIDVVRQMVAEHQAQLRATAIRVAGERAHPVRLWIGRSLVELGARIAREPAVAGAWAR
jgi:hypothetical protein